MVKKSAPAKDNHLSTPCECPGLRTTYTDAVAGSLLARAQTRTRRRSANLPAFDRQVRLAGKNLPVERRRNRRGGRTPQHPTQYRRVSRTRAPPKKNLPTASRSSPPAQIDPPRLPAR